MTTFLITGGAGFIGSSLADRLLDDNNEIIVIDNFNSYYSPRLKYQNIQEHLSNKNYKLYVGDIENIENIEQIFRENHIDCVIHLAAKAGVRPSIETPIAYAKTNIIGTMNILEIMKKYQVKRLIFASSSSVYGNSSEESFSETQNINQPISPYAATKVGCEAIAYTYHKLYNIEIYPLRFFTVYGPRQRPDLAINKFIRLIENHQPIDMFGDGTSMRDYTYIQDIIDGIQAVINYNKSGFEIFNLGGGHPVTLKNMIAIIESILGKKAIIQRKSEQPGDVARTIADISKAGKLLNYKPKFDLKKGIEQYIFWKKQITQGKDL